MGSEDMKTKFAFIVAHASQHAIRFKVHVSGHRCHPQLLFCLRDQRHGPEWSETTTVLWPLEALSCKGKRAAALKLVVEADARGFNRIAEKLYAIFFKVDLKAFERTPL